MNYQMDRANNLYIIRVDSLNDVIFQKVIKEILCIRGFEKKSMHIILTLQKITTIASWILIKENLI